MAPEARHASGTFYTPASLVEELLDAIRCLELDYPRHAAAARRIAEETFEASTIAGRMLDAAGFR